MEQSSHFGNHAGIIIIFFSILLFGIAQISMATKCFECEFWHENSTDQACLYPTAEHSSSTWTDTIDVVECEHSCFVSNTSSGDARSVKIMRGCSKTEYCRNQCVVDPVSGWEDCTHCCDDDDLCNDALPEEAFEDATWCYDCGSYQADCVNPSPETTVRTTCDTRCEMNAYISSHTTVIRGCALNEDDCDDCDDKEDCTMCCEGSYCNDATPDVVAMRSNLTQSCFSCFYGPNAFEVQDSGACGTEFNASGVGVELVQCSGVCKKVVSGSSVERSCVHNIKECKPGCKLFGSCTYCCTGDNCNRAKNMDHSNFLLTLTTALAFLLKMSQIL